MATITDHVIQKESGEYDTEVVKRLKIERYGLTAISNLESCTNLVELSLAWNEIRVLTGLNCLDNLRRLDLSHNKIERLEHLGEMVSLEWLNLKSNAIESISEIEALVPVTSLATLYLQNLDGGESNPVCGHPSYSTTIQRTLPQLQVLDGGHLLLVDATASLTEYVDSIGASSEARKTPPIVPWFQPSDLAVEGVEDVLNPTASAAEGGDAIRPFHCTENTMEAFASLDDEMTRVNQMLDEDSSHLLRKASTMYAKVSKVAESAGGGSDAAASTATSNASSKGASAAGKADSSNASGKKKK